MAKENGSPAQIARISLLIDALEKHFGLDEESENRKFENRRARVQALIDEK
jgi:hypothetical protein